VKLFGGAGLGTENRLLDYWDYLHSDLDLGELFRLRLFTVSEIVLLSSRCQQYNADDFGEEPDFNVVYQFNIAN